MSKKVYPRVGGETIPVAELRRDLQGLSPRGRGNLGPSTDPGVHDRSIPAWAGKPTPIEPMLLTRQVYPRVGGETGERLRSYLGMDGLSPRGRGNPVGRRARGGPGGSIPAWAGKPARGAGADPGPRVYPRVGGETSASAALRTSPKGLSPRGRGNPAGRAVRRGWKRSIPRVGGETAGALAAKAENAGLSPRGRGNPPRRQQRQSATGSIPAWAGKPQWIRRVEAPSEVYPRVGGETDHAHRDVPGLQGLSPRGRGNRRSAHDTATGRGSIPAWAGKPIVAKAFSSLAMVYPRVGGETNLR